MYVSFLACLGSGAETKYTVHVALPKRPINWFKLDQQSRQKSAKSLLYIYCDLKKNFKLGIASPLGLGQGIS